MFGRDNQSPEVHLRKKFWKELHEDRTVMLGLQGVEDDRTRPMTAHIDLRGGAKEEDGGPIYFFASRNEGIGQDLQDGARAVATFVSKNHGVYAHIHGTLHENTDRAIIDRLWNPFAAVWYEDGRDDPNLLLLRFDATRADLWESTPGQTLKAAVLKGLFDIDPGKDQQSEHQAEVSL